MALAQCGRTERPSTFYLLFCFSFVLTVHLKVCVLLKFLLLYLNRLPAEGILKPTLRQRPDVNCNTMNMLTKPGPFILFLYGLTVVLAILYAFYRLSLPFFNIFQSEALKVLAPLFIFLVFTFYIDAKRKTQLKRYSILAIILFICSLIINPSIKTFIVKDTEMRGEKLVKAIRNYKLKFGFLPKSLDEPFFNDYPTTALIHRPFYYHFDKVINNDTTFIIYTYSFDGLKAILRSNSINWYYSD